jgi:DNA-binding NarL/FixJ family response regulator
MNTQQAQTAPDQSHKHSVLVVDDHPVVREALVLVLKGEPDFVVVGQAGSASQAREALARLKPELVILDLGLPDCHGLELIKDIRAQSETPPIVVYSMHDESVYALRAIRAGANGYVMKRESKAKLLEALRTVAAGHYAVSLDVSTAFLNAFPEPEPSNPAAVLGSLTDRELEVFELIGKGAGTREIASYLNRSIGAVETCRLRIKEKLGFKHCAELASRAIRWMEYRDLSPGPEAPRQETTEGLDIASAL